MKLKINSEKTSVNLNEKPRIKKQARYLEIETEDKHVKPKRQI